MGDLRLTRANYLEATMHQPVLRIANSYILWSRYIRRKTADLCYNVIQRQTPRGSHEGHTFSHLILITQGQYTYESNAVINVHLLSSYNN